MSHEVTELSVSEARDNFSDAVNRAAFGGEITFVTRGRGHQRAAAIVPAELVERYETMVDLEDARNATERLADIDAGRSTAVPAPDVARSLGL
jgi:antitoxin (DNA-binding transcriptional repressor) of toxin-antitoxin stability system